MHAIERLPDPIFKTVIFATDLSPYSENAGRYAAFLAKHFAADLLVSHAFWLSQAAMEAEAMAHRPVKSRQRADLESELSNAVKRLGNGIERSLPVLLDGDPREQILGIAEKNAPSIIVLGTHGGGRIERGFLGSVAQGILRSSTWPTFTVGPQVPAFDADTPPFRRILYATDLEPAAAHAAAHAVAIATAFNSTIDVLHVIHPEDVNHPGRFSEIQKRFYTALDNIVPTQAKELCSPRSFVEVGVAEEKILEHLQEFSVDLLMLGIRKTHHLWTKMVTSGVFPIIADASCPVMTVTG